MKVSLPQQTSRRILVTGAGGMIGRAFVQQIVRYAPNCEVRALSRNEWDVRDSSPVAEFARWVDGGWIIHCAGLVDMERCAREAELAREIIVGGTANVTEIARRSRAKIIYPQSVFVYDGAELPITEESPLNPLSLYGALKLAAEAMVMAQSPANLVVRMAGFFGGEEKDKNFVGKIIPHLHRQILAGVTSFEVGDRIWQPTYTMDLALNSLALSAKDKNGVYVMGCHGEASFWELTVEIVRQLGWRDRIQIVKTPFENVSKNEIGRRPARTVVLNRRLQAEGLDMQRPWAEALSEYLAGDYFDRFRFT